MKTKLKIGCHKVSFSDEYPDNEHGDDWMGRMFQADNIIKVRKNMPSTNKQETAMHEILHSFFMYNGFTTENEENIVNLVSHNMIEFIQRNKQFFTNYFITGKDL